MNHSKVPKVAIQGLEGGYTNMAALQVFPNSNIYSFSTFDEAFEALENKTVDYAVIALENSTMGRVAEVHHILPSVNLHIVGECYVPINHALLGIKGAKLQDIKHVYSQPPALYQCHHTLNKLKVTKHNYYDTTAAAQHIAEKKDKTCAAIASILAGKMYDLEVLKYPVNDIDDNTTRFLTWARQSKTPPLNPKTPCKTTFMFETRSIPSALYKALGGFATNGINITKLESYVTCKNFSVAQFFMEIEGNIEDKKVKQAMAELEFFSKNIKILGCYPASVI